MTLKGMPTRPPAVELSEWQNLRPIGEDTTSFDLGYYGYEIGEDVREEAADYYGASAGTSYIARSWEDAFDLVLSAKKFAPLVPWFLLDPVNAFFTMAALAVDGSTHLFGIVPKKKRYVQMSSQESIERGDFTRRPDQRTLEDLLARLNMNFKWTSKLSEIARVWGYFFTEGEIDYISKIASEDELKKELRAVTGVNDQKSIVSVMNSITRAGTLLRHLGMVTNGRSLAISQKQMQHVRRHLLTLQDADLQKLLSINEPEPLISAFLDYRISFNNIMPISEAEYYIAANALVDFIKQHQAPEDPLTELNERLIRNSVPYLLRYDEIMAIRSKDVSVRPITVALILGFDVAKMSEGFYNANAYARLFGDTARVIGVVEKATILPFVPQAALNAVRGAALLRSNKAWRESFAHLADRSFDRELEEISEIRLMEISEERVVGDAQQRYSLQMEYIGSILSTYGIVQPEAGKVKTKLSSFPVFVLNALENISKEEPELALSLLTRMVVMPSKMAKKAGVKDKFIGDMTSPEERSGKTAFMALIEENLIPNLRVSIRSAYNFTLTQAEENAIFVELLNHSANELLALCMMPPVARMFILKFMGIDALKILSDREKQKRNGGGDSGGSSGAGPFGGLGGMGFGGSGPAEARSDTDPIPHYAAFKGVQASAPYYLFAEDDRTNGMSVPPSHPTVGTDEAQLLPFMEHAVENLVRALHAVADLPLADADLNGIVDAFKMFFRPDELAELSNTGTSIIGIEFVHLVAPDLMVNNSNSLRDTIIKVVMTGRILRRLSAVGDVKKLDEMSDREWKELRSFIMKKDMLSQKEMLQRVDIEPNTVLRDIYSEMAVENISSAFEQSIENDDDMARFRKSLITMPLYLLDDISSILRSGNAQDKVAVYAMLLTALVMPGNSIPPDGYSKKIAGKMTDDEGRLGLFYKLQDITDTLSETLLSGYSEYEVAGFIEKIAFNLWQSFPAQFLVGLTLLKSELSKTYILQMSGLIPFRNDVRGEDRKGTVWN